MILETGENYTLMNFYYSCTVPDIVRVLKSRTVRVVGYVACMGDLNNTAFWEQDTS